MSQGVEAANTPYPLTWLHCDHHAGLQREGSGNVWSVMDIHPQVMANVMRAVFSSSLEKVIATVLLEQWPLEGKSGMYKSAR